MRVRLFQEGGPAPAPQGQDPLMQIMEMAIQAVQNNDKDLALQVCQMLVDLAQQSQGGAQGGASNAAAEPVERGSEASAPEGEPVYRRGGRLVARYRW